MDPAWLARRKSIRKPFSLREVFLICSAWRPQSFESTKSLVRSHDCMRKLSATCMLKSPVRNAGVAPQLATPSPMCLSIDSSSFFLSASQRAPAWPYMDCLSKLVPLPVFLVPTKFGMVCQQERSVSHAMLSFYGLK